MYRDELFYETLTGLACIDCHETNLRDNPAAYAVLDRLATALVAAEREACANEADCWIGFGKSASDACDDIAMAILGRANSKAPNMKLSGGA